MQFKLLNEDKWSPHTGCYEDQMSYKSKIPSKSSRMGLQ